MERKLGESILESGKRVSDNVYEVPFIMSLRQFLSDSLILNEVSLFNLVLSHGLNYAHPTFFLMNNSHQFLYILHLGYEGSS